MSRIIGFFSEKTTDTGTDLTNKGDMHGFSDTNTRIPIGNNNLTLLADSSEDLGLKWGASATSTLTSAGDLLVASGANTLSRLARGSDNQVLKMNGTSLNWETVTAGLWTQIGNYRASSEESGVTFSSLGVDLDNDYSKIVLIMTGKSAGAFNGGFYLNAVSSGAKYDYTQIVNDSTTVAGSVINENVINVLPTGLVDGADNYFNIQLEITFSGIDDEFMYQWSAGAAHEGNIIGAGKSTLASSGDEIDTINVSFGANWRAGTQINLYKVAI